MNERKEHRAIHQAVDACLSGMTGDPRLAQRIICEEENPKMKKKMSWGLALLLVLALVSVGALAAVLYPKTVEQFTNVYGSEFGARLSGGDVAAVNSGHVDEMVKCTVTDVIWEGGVLYGTVVMEPADGAKVVLLPQEIEGAMTDNMADALTPDGKTTYAQAAEEKGAQLLVAVCKPDGYVLDGQTMSGEIGYFEQPQADGSLAASFELHGWNGGIQRAESYTLAMGLRVYPLTADGQIDYAQVQRTAWTVEVQPEMKAEEPATVTRVSAEGVVIETPKDYDGKMNTYAVNPRKEWQIDAGLFNASGVAKTDKRKSGATYTFNDEDQLDVDNEGYLYLYAYEGTETVMYQTADGKPIESDPMPRNEGPQQANRLVSWLRFEGEAEKADAALPEVTLVQAQAAAEELMEKLGLQMTCTWRYAADAATLTALNDEQNRKIENRELLNNNVWNEPFTAADEGYYLAYEARVDGTAAESAYAEAYFYVTRDGVRCCVIRAPFLLGESKGEQTLIDAEDALSKAAYVAKKSWLSYMAPALEKAKKIELIYAVQDQKLLMPAWRITAADPESGEENGYDFEVVVSAVDGTVLNGPWM